MSKNPTLAAVAAAAILALAAGCGSSDKPGFADQAMSASTPTEAAAPTTTEATAPASSGKPTAVPGPISKDLKKKPAVPKPKGDPPTKLISKDIVVGTGPAAKAGDNVTVKYVGVAWSNGKQFDASWDRKPNAFPFVLGQGNVIPGWDSGVVGMKVGGRRLLAIPADQAYGQAGSPPAIGPNEALVFVIDMVKISNG